MNVVMLLYPRLTQLDLTGPFEVFTRVKDLSIHLAWKDLDPVTDSGGLRLLPTTSFEQCPQADLLFVPGGPGQLPLMQDEQTLGFLRRQAAGAQFITSVCTGSLVLAAAGLLDGYRATSHWLSLEQLALLGAQPVAERVVWDRNRVTGAGVTSGIDFALTVIGRLYGDARAQDIQLSMEYDPAPPFNGGSPRHAKTDVLERVRAASAAFQAEREAVARTVGAAANDRR